MIMIRRKDKNDNQIVNKMEDNRGCMDRRTANIDNENVSMGIDDDNEYENNSKCNNTSTQQFSELTNEINQL